MPPSSAVPRSCQPTARPRSERLCIADVQPFLKLEALMYRLPLPAVSLSILFGFDEWFKSILHTISHSFFLTAVRLFWEFVNNRPKKKKAAGNLYAKKKVLGYFLIVLQGIMGRSCSLIATKSAPSPWLALLTSHYATLMQVTYHKQILLLLLLICRHITTMIKKND